MVDVAEAIHHLRRLLRREDVRSMSRRYFLSNGFDGVLTSVGIAMGAYLGGVASGWTVVRIGAAATVGLTTSAVWSVLEIERAEKLAETHRLERAMLLDLTDTQVHRVRVAARRINATMSGLGAFLGTLLPIVPFALEPLGLGLLDATLAAVGTGIVILFLFGSYLGSFSKQRWWWAGVRMGAAGAFVAILNVLLPG